MKYHNLLFTYVCIHLRFVQSTLEINIALVNNFHIVSLCATIGNTVSGDKLRNCLKSINKASGLKIRTYGISFRALKYSIYSSVYVWNVFVI